jgi:osmotically inducible protein OsmC
VDTTAKVHLDKVGDKYKITTIELEAKGDVPGIDDREFQRFAESARRSSLITQVMSGANIKLNAQLQS